MSEEDYTLITGASAGIGRALAVEFAAGGHKLILAARSGPQLDELAEELGSQHNVSCVAIVADLAAEGGPEKLCDALDEQGLCVDILVNNAGVLHHGKFWEIPLEKQRQLLRLNIEAVTMLTHRLLPAMVSRGRGRIMNVASTSAFNIAPSLCTYGASKAFMLSFTESLSVELKGTGISATALCPGFTETDMIAKGDHDGSMSLPLVRNLSAEEVAAQGYRSCLQGTPVTVTGLANRVFVGLSQYQPRWLRRVGIGFLAERGF